MVTGYDSTSAFASLADTPINILWSAVGLKICAVAAGIKNYTSIIKEKKSKHDKAVLLAKTKLNSTEILNSRTIIYWYISHDESESVNNVLREYDDMKEEIKTLVTSSTVH